MKNIAVGFVVCVLIVTIAVFYRVYPPEDIKDTIALGNFAVLVFTLIVLIWYAYDNNSIARVTRDRWIRESVLSAMYSMQLEEKKEGSTGKTMFRIHNPSALLVRAMVKCNYRIYGEPIKTKPAYDGEEEWLAFPQETIQGWFEIETWLQKKGKSVATMISESTPDNRKEQFTMLLEVEFSDELGNRRKLPPRPYHFDFDRWAWIPHITGGS